MSVIVTVRFRGDARRAHDVLREHPQLARTIRQGAADHHLVATRRLVGDGEYLDIDEWPTREDRDGFVGAMAPHIARWSGLAGVTWIESRFWRPASPEEEL